MTQVASQPAQSEYKPTGTLAQIADFVEQHGIPDEGLGSKLCTVNLKNGTSLSVRAGINGQTGRHLVRIETPAAQGKLGYKLGIADGQLEFFRVEMGEAFDLLNVNGPFTQGLYQAVLREAYDLLSRII